MYASLRALQKRLHNFAEEHNDPRDVRLADMEPDVEYRVYLIKKKLWELKMLTALIGPIANLAGTWLEGKVETKKAETGAKVAKARAEASYHGEEGYG